MEVGRIDIKKCNLLKDLTQDRPEWENTIHVVQGFDDNNDDMTITNWFMNLYNSTTSPCTK